MAVIDFGAVAPLPDGLPIELGMMIRLARDKNYDLLLPTMEKVGFIQKGEQVSVARDRRHAAPVRRARSRCEVFHYTRKWLQRWPRPTWPARRSRSRRPGRWICRPSWRSHCG